MQAKMKRLGIGILFDEESDVYECVKYYNLRKHYDRKEDVITLFLALQRQNFALGNALKNFMENSIIF